MQRLTRKQRKLVNHWNELRVACQTHGEHDAPAAVRHAMQALDALFANQMLKAALTSCRATVSKSYATGLAPLLP